MKRARIFAAVLLIFSILSFMISCGNGENTIAGSYDNFTEFESGAVSEGKNFSKSVTSKNLKLMLNESSAEIAVEDLKSGHIWYSNPQNRNEDETANEENKQILASQLILYYQNNTNQDSVMYSYKHSVAYGNFKCTKLDDGFEVLYHIGTESEDKGIPKAFTEKRYNELSEKMNSSDRSFLSRQYSLIKYEKLDDGETKDAIVEKYPEIKKQNLYILRSSNKNIYQKLRVLLEKYGYNENDLTADNKAAGISEENDNPVFQIAIEYRITDSDLIVNVPHDKLSSPEGYTITQIKLLPYFGSKDKNSSGEILLPDGSGSVMELNNGKTNEVEYETRIYGGNIANGDITGSYSERYAHLPIFAISAENDTFLAIIESAQAQASIHAAVSGMVSDNNTVYASFEMTESEKYQLGDNVGSSISFSSSMSSKSDLRIKYKLWGAKKSYSELATIYRNYLKENNMLPDEENEFNGLYVNFTGLDTYKTSIFGISCEKTLTMTTYEQAIEIAEILKKNGIDSVTINYSGWNVKADKRPMDKSLNLSAALGGEKSFSLLTEYCAKNSIRLNLDYELQIANEDDNWFDGFSRVSDAVKTVTGKYGRYVSSYRKDTYVSDELRYVFVPSLYNEFSEKIVKDFSKYPVLGVNVNGFASQLVNDYRNDNESLYDDCIEQIMSSLDKISGNGINITASNSNAYAIKYVSDYMGIDDTSAEYAVTDYTVPFLQMVIGEYAAYSGNYFNYDDQTENLLKCIETGAQLCVDFMYCKNDIIKNKEGLEGYYSAYYGNWIEKLSEAYSVLSDFRAQCNGYVTEHTRIDKNVYMVKYSNGGKVIVNYSSTNYEYGSIRVASQSFEII